VNFLLLPFDSLFLKVFLALLKEAAAKTLKVLDSKLHFFQ